MAKFRPRCWSSLFPKSKSICRLSRNACSRWRRIRIRKRFTDCSARCTRSRDRRRRLDCIASRASRTALKILIGRLRDGELRPSATIVDICLESVDTLKKFLYHQWPDEATLQTNVKSLLTRIANLAPEEQEESHRQQLPSPSATSMERFPPDC